MPLCPLILAVTNQKDLNLWQYLSETLESKLYASCLKGAFAEINAFLAQ